MADALEGQRPALATLPSTSKRYEQAESPKSFQKSYLSTISFLSRIPNYQRSSELALPVRSVQREVRALRIRHLDVEQMQGYLPLHFMSPCRRQLWDILLRRMVFHIGPVGGSDAFSRRKRSLSEIPLPRGSIESASVDVSTGGTPGHEELDDQGSEGGSSVGARTRQRENTH